MSSAHLSIESVPIESLEPDPENVRARNPAALESIVRSLARFGQQKPIVVTADGMIVAGHGTHEAAKQLGWATIDVVRTDLADTERKAFAIADNRTAELAHWDDAALAAALAELEHEDPEAREAAGFSLDELEALRRAAEAMGDTGVPGVDPDDPDDPDGTGLDADGNPYTIKIEPPTYEIRGDCPEIGDVVDTTKTRELLAEIRDADVPEDIREMLTLAAHRHTRFHYGRLAEFYAHATPEVQELMESSALVIVDLDSAISGGYVRVCERLRSLADRAVEQGEGSGYGE